MNVKVVTMLGTNFFLSNVITVNYGRPGVHIVTNENKFFFPFANIEYVQEKNEGEE